MAPGLFYYSLLQYKNLREEVEERNDNSLHNRPDNAAAQNNQRKYENQAVLLDKLHTPANKVGRERI